MKADNKVKTLRQLKYAVKRVDIKLKRLTILLITDSLILIACLIACLVLQAAGQSSIGGSLDDKSRGRGYQIPLPPKLFINNKKKEAVYAKRYTNKQG